jgi:hypothetical protein
MSRDAIEQIVGRAVVDRAFCNQLLEYPSRASEGYSLSEVERRLLDQIQAGTLTEFARKLEHRLEDGGLADRRAAESPLRRARRATA